MVQKNKTPLRWYNTSQGLWPAGSLTLAAQITTGNTTNATGGISTSGNFFVPTNLKADFSSAPTTNMIIRFWYGSFNLPEKYAYTGGVIGNGKALGLQDTITMAGNINIFSGTQGGSGARSVYSVYYSRETPTDLGAVTQGVHPADNAYMGLSYSATKSGIICEKDTQISMIIKY